MHLKVIKCLTCTFTRVGTQKCQSHSRFRTVRGAMSVTLIDVTPKSVSGLCHISECRAWNLYFHSQSFARLHFLYFYVPCGETGSLTTFFKQMVQCTFRTDASGHFHSASLWHVDPGHLGTISKMQLFASKTNCVLIQC